MNQATITGDRCPTCESPARVVTAVTVRTLGHDPRMVLVTRQCTGEHCALKYPELKPESRLSDEERSAWRQR